MEESEPELLLFCDWCFCGLVHTAIMLGLVRRCSTFQYMGEVGANYSSVFVINNNIL